MYKSKARWPESVYLANSDNTSEDSHATLSAASAICERLRKNGFGGDGIIFPIETWVEDEEGNRISAYESPSEPESEADKFVKAMSMFSSLGWDMPNFRFKNPSSADIRNDPEREKTTADLEKIAAAQAKRERKARK